MTDARNNLAAAIARRNEAAARLDAAEAAAGHAQSVLADLGAQHATLKAAERDQADAYAADLLAAFKAEGEMPAAAAAASASLGARRDLKALIETHTSVLARLSAEHEAARAAHEAATKTTDAAARQVANEAAIEVARDVEVAHLQLTRLRRRLRTFEMSAAPRVPMGANGVTAPSIPIEVGKAMVRQVQEVVRPAPVFDMDATKASGRPSFIAPAGEDVWAAEEDAWKRHLADLGEDAEARYTPPTRAAA